MSQNVCIPLGSSAACTLPLPSFASKEAVETYFKGIPRAWDSFLLLPTEMQRELVDFCLGKQGLKITYDSVFRKIFHPQSSNGLLRLEALLSAILERRVKIVKIIPREGTQMNESGSFVVMDILVQLDDGSYANVEMQKIGYNFPLARADCYVSDIIMRQYVDTKAILGDKFTFHAMHKVYSIILMEKSPKEFHTVDGSFIHRRKAAFDTGIYKQECGLHEDIFLCLDSFRSAVHNVTKNSNELEAWMTFLSATEPDKIHMLIEAFPEFASIYQEVTNFVKDPGELIAMLSKELYIMDRNLERLMVEEAQEEATKAKAERDDAVAKLDHMVAECNIFKLKCKNKTSEEIAEELKLSVEYVNRVLEAE